MSNLKNKRGQGLVEYILVLVIMALLAVGSIRALGKNVHNGFSAASSALNQDLTNANTNVNNDKTL